MAITSLMLQNPLLSITLISAGLALATTLVYKYATDQNLMRQIREDTKKYQEQLKTHKDDPQKMLEIQNQMMPLQSKMMMQSFKPMLITIIPFIIIFKLLGDVYTTLIVIPLSFWPGHLGWIGVYVIVSMIFTTIFRKALKVV